jgi:NAD-dependent oxidoreductase involved in siderophore biosynthesis
LHFPMAKAALQAGKHVLCEKPLASTVAEATEMIALAKKKGLANCTLYNVRAYPQVQNMRRMCEAGEFGEIRVVQGTYSQDWLLYDTDWNWRAQANENGASSRSRPAPSPTSAHIGATWPSTLPLSASLPSAPISRPFTQNARSRSTRWRPLPARHCGRASTTRLPSRQRTSAR